VIIYNYIFWQPKIISVPLLGWVVWWLGLQYDKVRFFAQRDRLQRDELQRSNERFQAIFDRAGMSIVLLDNTGRFVLVNPTVERMLGYSEEEMRRMTIADVTHPDDISKNMNLLKELLEGKIDSYQLEKRYIHKNGHIVWGKVKSTLFPIKDDENNYVLGMLVDITELKETEKKLREANQKLEYISSQDGLTGIANRCYFDSYLRQEWEQAKQNNQPLSLIMIDVDFFKRLNDTYGHMCGDDCLIQVANLLKQNIRKTDLVARYGGEEFSVILPRTDSSGAYLLAEKIRAAIEQSNIPHTKSSVRDVVTVSVGTATLIPTASLKPEDLILRADEALYEAKRDGRNRVKQRISN
jgi:diguanylate cyclase (GGDEF)-like protein/PAS domain S-box-containing protein